MSNVTVTLAANRIQVFRDDTPDELLNSVTYINVTSVNPLTEVKKRLTGTVPGMDDPGADPTVDTESVDWIVELHMADGRDERINLADVTSPAGWTNDEAGYAQAEADIYAAFPSSGGGGAFMPIAGGTFTGPIALNNDATSGLQPTTFQQVDTYLDDVYATIAANSFKVYSAIVAMTGVIVTDQEYNTTGAIPSWSYDSVGRATLTLTGVFTNNKTSPQICVSDVDSTLTTSIARLSTDTVQIGANDLSGNPADGVVNVTIIIYP